MPISCANCGRWKGKNHNCPSQNPMKGKKRKDKGHWKGGRIIINGYVYIYSPNHPNKIFGRYIAEHRLIMEKRIGRLLKKDEIIHHINENTFDNRIENLELINRSKHNTIHKTKEIIK